MEEEKQQDEVVAALRATGCPTPPEERPVDDVDDDDDGVHPAGDPAVATLIAEVERQLSRVYVSDDADRGRAAPPAPPKRLLPIHSPHAYPCAETYDQLPAPPSQWPQRPVLLRPTPNGDTVVRGIRRAGAVDYRRFGGFCAGCSLPLNTGGEAPGRSVVIDFESEYFVGTLLMRIRGIAPPDSDATGSAHPNYFDGKKRRFQAVVRGKFKKELPMCECVTGQAFDRPVGKMPARWIVSSFLKFATALVPQMEVAIDGDNPRCLTPLVATAHTVQARQETTQTQTTEEHTEDGEDDGRGERSFNYDVYAGSVDMEAPLEEPHASDRTSLLPHAAPHDPTAATAVAAPTPTSLASRQKTRKKVYNRLYAHRAARPRFRLDTEYTFEFYQHLLLFDRTLALDMGSLVGAVPLAPVTDGQPLKFMSAHREPNTGALNYLWSFDIWHESLYDLARHAEAQRRIKSTTERPS